jgi:hypothetical protein
MAQTIAALSAAKSQVQVRWSHASPLVLRWTEIGGLSSCPRAKALALRVSELSITEQMLKDAPQFSDEGNTILHLCINSSMSFRNSEEACSSPE